MLVVIVVSLCLLGVPLVTKFLVPLVHSTNSVEHQATTTSHSFPYQLFSKVLSDMSGQSLVVSPCAVQAVLGSLGKWGEGATRDQLFSLGGNSSQMCGGNTSMVLLVPEQGLRKEVQGKVIQRLDYRVKEAGLQIAEWLKRHTQKEQEAEWVVKGLDNSQVVGLAVSSMQLSLGKEVVGQFLGQETAMVRVQGGVRRGMLEHSSVTVLEGEGGMSLCLVVPLTTGDELSGGEECWDTRVTSSQDSVTLPKLQLSSQLTLAPALLAMGLRVVGEEAELGPLSTQSGLKLGQLYQMAQFSIQPSDQEGKKGLPEGENIVIDRPFTFLVGHKSLNRTIFIGTYIGSTPH